MKKINWSLNYRKDEDIKLEADLVTMYQDGDTVTSTGVILLNKKKIRSISIDHPAWLVFFKKPRKKRIPYRFLTYALAHKLHYALHNSKKGKKRIDRIVADYFGLADEKSVLTARNKYLKKWVPESSTELFIDGRKSKSPSVFIIILEPDKFDSEMLGNGPVSYDGRFMLWKDDMSPYQNLLLGNGKITANFV